MLPCLWNLNHSHLIGGHLAKLILEVFLKSLVLVRKPQTWGCVFVDLIDSFELGSRGKFVFLVTMWVQYILWKTENDHLLWAGNIWCTFFFFLTCCSIVFSLPLIIYIEKKATFWLNQLSTKKLNMQIYARSKRQWTKI